jgi:hypothetical protein
LAGVLFLSGTPDSARRVDHASKTSKAKALLGGRAGRTVSHERVEIARSHFVLSWVYGKRIVSFSVRIDE